MPDDMFSEMQDMKRQGAPNDKVMQHMQDQGASSGEMLDALQPPPVQPQMPPMQPAMPPVNPLPSSDTEELVEAIIDEKWNDLMGDINKVITWKESSEQRILKMEQQLGEMKDQFDKLHQAIIAKVGEYDQHILDVGAEVKAMEKVFSKVLPVFTDNVAELSRITHKMKPKKK